LLPALRVAVKFVALPIVVGLSLAALRPVIGMSFTATTISSGVESGRPVLSVTLRVKVSTAGELGAVNVAVTLLLLFSITGVPPVCVH
jgi:hypothetical protein